MKVTDLNGCPIEVTNLDEAIGIASQYSNTGMKIKALPILMQGKMRIGQICTKN